MDELDREEFYRLKKVSGKKQRDAAVEEAARLEAKQAAEAKESAKDSTKDSAKADAAESKDLLGDEDNQDVIF